MKFIFVQHQHEATKRERWKNTSGTLHLGGYRLFTTKEKLLLTFSKLTNNDTI